MEESNYGMEEFYYRSRFIGEKVPLDAAVTNVVDGPCSQVTGQTIADLVHAIGNNWKAFAEQPEESARAPTDFAYCGWVES